MPANRPQAKIQPMKAMPISSAPEETLVVRPSQMPQVKPTLWQRIWYGASAERKVQQLAESSQIGDQMREVKAGVLAEMQNISRSRGAAGAVSGSPFANVMLPLNARANKPDQAQTQAKAKAQRTRGGWMIWLVGGALLLAFLLIYAPQRGGIGPVAGPTDTLGTQGASLASAAQDQPLLPPPSRFNQLPEQAETKPAPVVDLLANQTPRQPGASLAGPAAQQLDAASLGKVVRVAGLTSAPVANQANQMVLAAQFTNSGRQPLQQMQWQLAINDQVGVPLLRQTVVFGEALAPGVTATQRVVVALRTPTERLLARVPLKALQVSLTPLKATVQ